jgi:hypothetical protein
MASIAPSERLSSSRQREGSSATAPRPLERLNRATPTVDPEAPPPRRTRARIGLPLARVVGRPPDVRKRTARGATQFA